jgi:hypothetical protein
MKVMHAALTAAAILAAAPTACLAAGPIDDFVKVAIVGNHTTSVPPAYLIKPEPGYIAYYGHPEVLPAPSCYWTRMPVHDFAGKVIGWRGQPVAVCP